MTHDAELKHSNDGALVGSFVEVEEMSHLGQGQDDEVTQNPCKDGSSVVVEAHEPYVGQEFDTEETAQAFYNAYGMRVGFMTRMNYLARSKHGGTIIGRTFVCNKEGYRKPDRRDKTTIKPRAPTRVGCKAMLSIKKISIGKWVVTRFMKEHTHALTATANKGQKGLIADQVPIINQIGQLESLHTLCICGIDIGMVKYVKFNWLDDKTKIEELTRELFLERKQSASLREIVDLLFDHIEEHTQDLSKKVQYVVDKVKEIESEGKSPSILNLMYTVYIHISFII
ncbi:protein FAR1-RELATED SEQUENCE 12 isoform X3 [Prunus persica]|uniref:protein FAR1-RELATED SEQUENCE 12 isoform X3 n=1 Tax=Prunus persica TaxID=3760 RepID=UPI0009AB4DA1|nr:protein FAR1-RELATED SEQUENCE 12 isoform X3 [Prunus persica]